MLYPAEHTLVHRHTDKERLRKRAVPVCEFNLEMVVGELLQERRAGQFLRCMPRCCVVFSRQTCTYPCTYRPKKRSLRTSSPIPSSSKPLNLPLP